MNRHSQSLPYPNLLPASNCGRAASSVKRGFTLIELLVVISIIALLAAILFPVFARVRENARRSACMSNMKQIGLGILQYTQDYDEKLPYGGGTEITTPTIDFPTIVLPYTKAPSIYKCPDDTLTNGVAAALSTSSPAYPISYYYHYSFYHVFNDITGSLTYGSPKTVAVSAVAHPSQKVMVECGMSDSVVLCVNSNTCGTTGNLTAPPHGGKFILSLFADGHAKHVNFANFANNSTYGYKAYGGASVFYNFDWTPWGVQSVNGIGGKDLKD